MFHQNPTRIWWEIPCFLGIPMENLKKIGWFGVIQSIYELTKTSAGVFKLQERTNLRRVCRNYYSQGAKLGVFRFVKPHLLRK